jgi:HSP20 family protein
MRSPFDELLALRNELDRLSAGIVRDVTQHGGIFPAVNIYDNGEAFLVRAEVPGIDKNAIDIASKGQQLTIRGERVVKPAQNQASYHRREREGGTFRRVVTLPEQIDANKIDATYNNGVLEIVVPRAPEAKPRQIRIGGQS